MAINIIKNRRGRGWVVYDTAYLHKGLRKTFNSRREAEQYRDKVVGEIEQHGEFRPAEGAPLVREKIEEYMEREDRRGKNHGAIRPASLKQKEIALRQICEITIDGVRIGNMQLSVFDKELVEDKVVDALLDHYDAHATAERKFKCFTHYLRWAYAKKYTRVELIDIAFPAAPATASVKQVDAETVDRLIEAMPENERVVALVAAWTGMRAGEQRALTWADVDLTPGAERIKVRRAVKHEGDVGAPKTRHGSRDIPLRDEVAQALRKWKAAQPIEQRGNDLVFPGRDGSIVEKQYWNRSILRRAKRATGISDFRWHDFRHHMASFCLFQTKMTMAEVAAILGHHSPEFTYQVYSAWGISERQATNYNAMFNAAAAGRV